MTAKGFFGSINWITMNCNPILGYGSWCQSLRCQMVHSVKRNIYFKEILFQLILLKEFHFMEFREIRFPWNQFISRNFFLGFPSNQFSENESNQFSENPWSQFIWIWIRQTFLCENLSSQNIFRCFLSTIIHYLASVSFYLDYPRCKTIEVSNTTWLCQAVSMSGSCTRHQVQSASGLTIREKFRHSSIQSSSPSHKNPQPAACHLPPKCSMAK